jgi:hypothetical protein
MAQMNHNIERFQVIVRNFLMALQSSSSQLPTGSPPQPQTSNAMLNQGISQQQTSNPQKSNSQPNANQPPIGFNPPENLYGAQEEVPGLFNTTSYSLDFKPLCFLEPEWM